MAQIDLAVKMGTANTSIFMAGNGIVLYEPTILAYVGDSVKSHVKAVGNEALEMVGRTPEYSTLLYPVMDGLISDPDACVEILERFLRKIIPTYIIKPHINMIFGIPSGLNMQERLLYEEIALKAGAKSVTLVENIILSAIGLDLPIQSNYGAFIVNIGAGITEIGSVSLCSVVSGCAVNIGGNMMDAALKDYLAGKYNIRVGINELRNLKISIGSLFPNDARSETVSGMDTFTSNITTADITSVDIRTVLLPYYLQIADTIEGVINNCTPEIGSDIKRRGIYLTGGCSCIPGLKETFEKKLGLNVHIGEDAAYSSIIGAGKLMSNPALLKAILDK